MAYYALKKDVFDINKVTVVGSPTIMSDGVVTATSGYSGNCPYIEIPALGDNWEMVVPFNWVNPTNRSTETFFRSVKPGYKCFSLGATGTQIYLWMQDINQTDYNIGFTGITNFTNLLIKITCQKVTDGYLISVLSSNDDGKTWTTNKTQTVTVAPYICQNALTYQAFIPTQVNANVTMDLTKFSYSNGTISFSPTKPAYLLERRKEGYDSSKFTVVGTPTITSNGVASGFSSATNKYIEVPFNYLTEDFKIKLKFTTGQTIASNYLFGTYLNNDIFSIWRLTGSLEPRVFFDVDGVRTSSVNLFGSKYISITLETLTCYDLLIERKDGYITFACKKEVEETYKQVQFEANYPLFLSTNGNIRISNDIGASIDLPSISITVDGKEVFTGSKYVYYAMEK